MLTAEELLGTSVREVKSRGVIVSLSGFRDVDADGEPPIVVSKFVEDLCRELSTGITSVALARMTGYEIKLISHYLRRLERRGTLEEVGTLKPTRDSFGRPPKIYRVKVAA